MLDLNTSTEARRQLAEADDTPADILEELSINSDRSVRALVASNPNTPMEVLVKLGVDFAEEITANPVFSLLILEHPVDNFIRRCLARSLTTSTKILSNLAADSDYLVTYYVAENPNTPPASLLFLVENGYGCYTGTFDNVNFPLNSLEKLAEHSKTGIRAGIASSVNTSVKILEKLSTDRKPSIRADVARNVNTPVYILEKLSTDSSPFVLNWLLEILIRQ